jgi:L-threonylcarbamoyladenylate synthase
VSIIGKDIDYVAKLLSNGGIVAIPTETVYGLAANAFDATAVVKIFEAKKRPFFDPLIVHTHSIERVVEFVLEVPDLVKQLYQKFSPGPLTILLKRNADIIPDIVTSGLDTVAVRIPNHPLTLQLLEQLPFPLAAPSANPFGYVSPTTAQHVVDQLGNEVPYILDGGACDVGVESTIISVEGNKIVIHRLGGVTVDDLKAFASIVELRINSSSNPVAPGTLESHYSPNKRLYYEDAIPTGVNLENAFYIGYNKYHSDIKKEHQLLLSEKGDLAEAAHNLFAALRNADKVAEGDIIIAHLPNIGLGMAINDRLNRAVKGH